MHSLQAMNMSASDWAVKSGVFSMGGGDTGPSVDDIMKTWKTHKVKEKRHFSLWTFIKRCFWSIIMFLILFIIVQVGWKIFEFWQLKKKFMKYGKRIKDLISEKEIFGGQLTDALSQISRLSSAVFKKKRGRNDEEETERNAEERVEMNAVNQNY